MNSIKIIFVKQFNHSFFIGAFELKLAKEQGLSDRATFQVNSSLGHVFLFFDVN